jgi:hypothetical protein
LVVDDAIEMLLAALPEAQRAALIKATAGGSTTPEEACAAFRALADGAKALPPAGRDAVIWSASNPGGPT